MLLSVLSNLRRRARYRTSTGRETEASSCPHPACWHKRLSHREGQLSVTWRGRGHGRVRQQSSATERWSPCWCDCSQDFLVNFNKWDGESPWSLPPTKSRCACVESLTARGSRTTLLSGCPTHTHKHIRTLSNVPLHVLCPGAPKDVTIPFFPPLSLKASLLETWGICTVSSFIPLSSAPFSCSSSQISCESFSVPGILSILLHILAVFTCNSNWGFQSAK